jgi:hypothetical protein
VHQAKSSDSGGIRDDYIIDFKLRPEGCGVKFSQRSTDPGTHLARANAPATVPLVWTVADAHRQLTAESELDLGAGLEGMNVTALVVPLIASVLYVRKHIVEH